MDSIRRRLSSIRRRSEVHTSEGSNSVGRGASSAIPSHSVGYQPPPSEIAHFSMPLRSPPSTDGATQLPPPEREYRDSKPLFADFDTAHLVLGGGVAIFHVATSRVVLCWHTRDEYWFLPKGRRDVGEESGAGAEREGFEEVSTRLCFYGLAVRARLLVPMCINALLALSSHLEHFHSWVLSNNLHQSGFRNRLLPIPFPHRQPTASSITVSLPPLPSLNSALPSTARPIRHEPPSSHLPPYCTEPILTQLMPLTRKRQYLLHWYVAETLPPGTETRVNATMMQIASTNGLHPREVYVRPPPFPKGLTLRARAEQDWAGADGQQLKPSIGEECHDVEATTQNKRSTASECATTTNGGVGERPGQASSEPQREKTVLVRGAKFHMESSPAIDDTEWRIPNNALTSNRCAAQQCADADLSTNDLGSKQTTKLQHGVPKVGSSGSHLPSTLKERGITPSQPPALPLQPYSPQRHCNTGVNEEEALYSSSLVPVEEAVQLLAGSGMECVVRWGWEGICRRWAGEEKAAGDV